MHSINYSKRIYCLITGASRGIGRTIAVELARRSNNNLTVVLIARSQTGLTETETFIKNVNPNAVVVLQQLDLKKADASNFEQIIQKSFQSSDFDSALLFHNAGYIGNIQKAIELMDKKLWQDYFDLNVTSATVLNSVFLKMVKTSELFVINITSLLGRKAFKYFAMYGSAKAARDFYFKILAEEQPEVTVLNYSPGMVDTSMANELISTIKNCEDSELASSVKNPSILTPEQTVSKMFSILEKAEFKSGDIIDYYD